MRKISFGGLGLRVLDEKAEAAIRASGESTIFHACVRVADCAIDCDCQMHAAAALRSHVRECPGCGHRIWVTPPFPKTLLPIVMCNQCVFAHFEGRTVDGYLPPGWRL